VARDYVRDKEAVQDLNKELIRGEDFIRKQEGAAAKLLDTIGGINQALKASGDFSEKNKKQADLLAGAGQASLKFAQSKSKKDKESFDKIVQKYKVYKDLGGEQIKELDTLIKQTGEIAVQEGLLSRINISQDDITAALKDQVPFGKQLSTLFSKKAKGAAKVAAGLTIAVTILKDFAAKTAIIGEEFGALGMQSGEFKSTLLSSEVGAQRLGMGMKDVADVTKELTTNFGFTNLEAANLSGKVLDTSKALGLSNTEGAKLFGTLINIGGLSAETAEQFSESAAQLAKANGAAPTVVLKDLADSSETIAKFTGMTPDNLAKAAIQANKLGLSLKDIGGVAEGLLDFQGSLNKEIEASILLGRDINLQKARELALNNDLKGVAVEITKQVGSEAEFNKLNLIQRKALADSIGLSVEQLSKVVTNQDKVKSINDAIAGTDSFEDLLGRDSLDNITKIANDFKAIGANLVNTIGPVISQVVGGIASFTEYLSKSPMLVKTITGLLAGLAVKNLIGATAGIFGATVGKFGLIGIPMAMGLMAMMKTQVSSAKTMASAQEGGITTQEGLVNVHPQEAIVPIEKLGGMIKDAMKPIADENRKLREQNETLIGETRRIGSRTAEAIANIS
jgi:hypothetical protein